ncbi:MAG: RloB domain-containing protein [Lachnospiraceae bacterium]|nr:RloB domain-containing protein [Lachnospiraceae bacterium]
MAKMKSTKKYYFTVEGETEQWYLKWLQDRINETEASAYKVTFDCPVQKNPLKRAKSLVVTGKTEVWHLSDYESDDPIHTKQFTETMDNMKAAKEVGKQITYKFGYTNLTFDLWIILHKADCNASYTHRKNYITPLNRAYGEQFEYMKEYKHEDNFKRCLGKLELSNVIEAVNRAKRIMVRNEENGYKLLQYKGYKYYKENPSMAIHEIIGKILKDCELI